MLIMFVSLCVQSSAVHDRVMHFVGSCPARYGTLMADPQHLLQTLASIHQHASQVLCSATQIHSNFRGQTRKPSTCLQVDAVVGGEAAAVAAVNKDLAATCTLLHKK
jgi:hypothetical protein